MNVTTERLDQCELLLTVEADPQQERTLLQKAAKKFAGQYKIPGFRPGRAPFHVVVSRVGIEAVQQEALDQGVKRLIQEALEEADVTPYAQMSLENIEWDPLILKVKVPTKPEVELIDYRTIRLDYEPVVVTDEDVKEVLERMQAERAVWAPVERPAELDDLITMSMVERDGDEILAERDSVEHELVDSDETDEESDRPDLTTPLLGLSAGEEKTFTLTYPESFSDERYAGKEITFEVSVSSVKEKELEPLDDEFVQSVSDFETLAEYKEDIREKLRQKRREDRDRKLGSEALDKIVEESRIVWPQAFEDEQLNHEVQQYQRRMENYGLNLEGYLEMQRQTPDEFKESLRPETITRFQRGLVIGQIISNEELEVSEGEILEQAKAIADYSGGGDQVWRNILASPEQHKSLADDMIINKVVLWLGAIARGEDPDMALEAQQEEPETTEETPAEETDGANSSDEATSEAEGEPTEEEPAKSTEA